MDGDVKFMPKTKEITFLRIYYKRMEKARKGN